MRKASIVSTTTVEEISLTSSLGLMIAKLRSGITRYLENMMVLYCYEIRFILQNGSYTVY